MIRQWSAHEYHGAIGYAFIGQNAHENRPVIVVEWRWQGRRHTNEYHLTPRFAEGEGRASRAIEIYDVSHLPPRLADYLASLTQPPAFEFIRGVENPEQGQMVIRRVRLLEGVQPPPTTGRLIRLASMVAVEPESYDEWRNHLQELAATGTRREVIRFAIQILYAGLHSRMTWLARQALSPGINLLCWTLRSQARTWVTLSALLLWAGLETAADTGVGAALLVVLAGFSGIFWLVEWLRNRYNAHPPQDKKGPPD